MPAAAVAAIRRPLGFRRSAANCAIPGFTPLAYGRLPGTDCGKRDGAAGSIADYQLGRCA